MMTVSFTVPGQPVAKARARVAVRNGLAMAYTPAKTRHYEETVRTYALQAMNGQTRSERPISLDLTLLMAIPASWSKVRQAAAHGGAIRATKKPDADNMLKAIKDACNGVLWRDDSQVVEMTIRKRYSREPGIWVIVRELEGESA